MITDHCQALLNIDTDTEQYLMSCLLSYRFGCNFIDGFFRENARRTLAMDPPLSVRQAKESWNEAIEKRAAFYPRDAKKADGARNDGGQDGYRSDGSRGRGGGKRGGGSSTGSQRGGAYQRGKGAKLNGDSVCYHFNRAAGCSRTLKGAGCDNGNGGVYAHACNFETAPGTYCLDKHPKAGNH